MCGDHVDDLLVFRYFVDISRDGSAKLIHQLSVHEVYLTDDVIIATLQAMLFATLSLCSTKKMFRTLFSLILLLSSINSVSLKCKDH